MPPLSIASRSYVYAITRRDFEHQLDYHGRLELVEIHSALKSANRAARDYFGIEKVKVEKVFDLNEQEDENQGCTGWCHVVEYGCDRFKVEVKRIALEGGKLTDKKIRSPIASKSKEASGSTTTREEGTVQQPVVLF
ncbi:MAG: hypothetical protein L6R41_007071 [Letrouitia leprolyta]|nr:MAG: hypothetical protein L6R41_007071 [Letrouitia leprolyta]